LSRIATLFDPLQFLDPVIRAKMALQEAWLRGLEWGEEFPCDLKVTTQQWAEQLAETSNVKVQRCYRLDEKVEQVSLHTFTDTFKLAYAAVSYARYRYVSGKISVALVTTKARATPIKSVSIPRLELMAAVLGVRLAETVSQKMEIPLSERTLWTDSMDVIYWVQGDSRRLISFVFFVFFFVVCNLVSFVANRVTKVQRRTSPAQWRHVPGE